MFDTCEAASRQQARNSFDFDVKIAFPVSEPSSATHLNLDWAGKMTYSLPTLPGPCTIGWTFWRLDGLPLNPPFECTFERPGQGAPFSLVQSMPGIKRVFAPVTAFFNKLVEGHDVRHLFVYFL